MTPKELNDSLNKLIENAQLSTETKTAIRKIMLSIKLLPSLNESTKAEFCIKILKTLQKDFSHIYSL